MLVHNVFFWLRRDLTAAERKSFEEGLQSLTTIPTMRQGFWGPPSSTNRPIIDRTYDYGLVEVFDDIAGHDTYQVHPIHNKFLEMHQDKWIKVTIYDFER